MDYIKIRFCNELSDRECQFGKSIEEMFRSISPVFRLSEHSWKPQMDIYETPEEIYILAELSGVSKDDLDIEINSKAIRIQGYRKPIPRVENANYRLAEIQYGRFERVLFLPVPIDTEKVAAAFKNGLLTMQMAKQPRERVRKISISED